MRDPRLTEFGDLYPFQSHYLELPRPPDSPSGSGETGLDSPLVGAQPGSARPSMTGKASSIVRMHYVDEGQGSPIVLLHGNPTWSFYYRELIKSLRDTHRVIAPDHIGCGLSDKPQDYPYTLATHIENLARLIDTLQLSDITLGVHDWGGPIGLGWAVRNPERVKRLVIFNTAAFLEGEMPLRIRVCGWPILGSIAVRGLNLFARAALRMATAKPRRFTPLMRRGYLLPYDTYANRVAILRFVQDIPLSPAVPSYAALEGIERQLPVLAELPMTIFWGMKDFCFTPAFVEAWVARFPKAEVHRLADCGHYVVEDGREDILNWWRSPA